MGTRKERPELIDESDRGAVIVAAALLEDDLSEMLKDIIRRNGVSAKQVKEIFDLSGPLSSFSSKALICHAFGLISKDTFDDLGKIRKLRNKFAHSTSKVDFLSPDIEDHIAEIKCCVEASKNFKGELFKGRGFSAEISEPKAVVLEDWEARAKGFVKYTKAVFCTGISILRLQIKEQHLHRIET
jgi:hypothetical protein